MFWWYPEQAIEIPQPVVVIIDCLACDGYGRHRDTRRSCGACEGKGSFFRVLEVPILTG